MKLPKVLAIYLPQFHETDSNNKWWGKGFTDWVSVKNATPLFSGHVQPRVPIDREYYDLADVKVMKKQAELAGKYGIDGFVFYHYYFDADNIELHKPAENYLLNTDIDFPFCFCWANESWVRTWSKINGNVWGEKFDKENGNEDIGILALQKYGGLMEWKTHFEYLLPFFQDQRYIKIDNKPVIIIYAPENIPTLSDMLQTWRVLANQQGFSGVFVIGSNTDSCQGCLDAVMFNEPAFSMRSMREKGQFFVEQGVTCFDYKEYWDEVLSVPAIIDGTSFFTATVGYDTTPRRGRNGECFVNYSPELFYEGLKKLIAKSNGCGSEILFIDAWNEWGEGMHLEPDLAEGYSYLEAVNKAKEDACKMDPNAANKSKLDYVTREFSNLKASMIKYKSQYGLLASWLSFEQAGMPIFRFFMESNNIKTIAIYGYSDIGRLLRVQLEKENIEVLYAIDRYVGDNSSDIRVYRIEENIPYVDMIVITVYGASYIIDNLKRKYSGKIITIWELFERATKE